MKKDIQQNLGAHAAACAEDKTKCKISGPYVFNIEESSEVVNKAREHLNTLEKRILEYPRAEDVFVKIQKDVRPVILKCLS